MVGIIFITDMIGIFYWILAVIAIFLLLKGYYDYKYFIACYDGLISWGRWIKEKLHDWKIWIKEKQENLHEWWQNLITLKKTDFVLATFVTMVLLINLFLDFIDRYHSLFIVFCFIVYLVLRSIYLHPSDINFPKKQIKKFLAGRWKWFKSIRPLKQAYLVVAGVIAFALFILFISLYLEILLFDWGGTGTTEITKTTGNADSSIRNLAIAFLGTTSGIGALFGVFLAILRSEENKRQNDTAEQGLITDRINKAVESLGKIDGKDKPVLEVRIGALYALERIAQDSLRDHIRIMKIISGYIYVRDSLTNSTGEIKAVKEDVRAALIVIGQRGKWTEDQRHLENEKEQGYELDLRHCNLKNADLAYANMSNAHFINSTLETTQLTRAILRNTDLDSTNLTKAGLFRTDFKGAHMGEAFAYEGDFSRCLNLTQKQLNIMYCGNDVKIPKMDGEKEIVRPGHWPEDDLTRKEFIESYEEWKKTK